MHTPSSSFSVRPDDLRRMSGDMRAVHAALDGATASSSSLHADGVPAIGDALIGYTTAWDRSYRAAGTTADFLATALGQAAGRYRRTEGHVCHGFHQHHHR